MDKEKYLKYREYVDLYEKYEKKYREINYLLDNYTCFFKDEESIKALKRIREYFYSVGKKLNKLRNNMQMEHFEMVCKHEILTKFDIGPQKYYCPLCGIRMDEVSGDAIIITGNSYVREFQPTYALINKVIKDIIDRDLDIFTNFEVEFAKKKETLGIKSIYTLRRKYVKA